MTIFESGYMGYTNLLLLFGFILFLRVPAFPLSDDVAVMVDAYVMGVDKSGILRLSVQ
jgi:hypothetical protein